MTWTNTFENEYPASDEFSKINSPVLGDCIACDVLFSLLIFGLERE